ncbi:hypothetical protein ACFQNE_11435 [Gordonia phosphorivorans]|uniref:ThuA-like domain-containing protein n=1 Tax=Gordonia phosphorivorans TaxID=1056982 RepID=A0ABV6H9Y0_9ACTN
MTTLDRVSPVAHLTMGTALGMPGPTTEHLELDLYDLPELDTNAVRGLIVNSACDQIFLERRRDLLTDFVTGGGRIAVMGHALTDFLPGLGRWRRLQYSGPKDLAITADTAHPVWAGVDTADLTFRRGVSGFYARGYSERLPDGATVINRIGRLGLPVDYVYRLGAGEVLVHGGLDLAVYRHDPNTSARIFPQLLQWLSGQETPA